MKKPILIIGDSPFLGEIEDKLHYLLELYSSIGINNAIRKYNVQTHIFQDIKFVALTNKYPEVKTVSLYMYGDMIQKDNKDLIDSYTFNFKKDTCTNLLRENKLAWCGFTHDYAISYCITKGYTDIILVGTADFTGAQHYITSEIFSPSEKLVELSKKFIEEVCTQRANIYTLNPNSSLKVPRVTIDELLNMEKTFQK